MISHAPNPAKFDASVSYTAPARPRIYIPRNDELAQHFEYIFSEQAAEAGQAAQENIEQSLTWISRAWLTAVDVEIARNNNGRAPAACSQLVQCTKH